MFTGDDVNHLLWGVTLFTLYIVLWAMVAPLMRLSAPLAPSQTFALLTLGEFLSFLPCLGIAKRQWSIKKWQEWVTFALLGVVLACNFAVNIYCSQNMPLGKGKRCFEDVRINGWTHGWTDARTKRHLKKDSRKHLESNKAGYTAQDAPSKHLKITRDRRTDGRTRPLIEMRRRI